MVNWAPWAAGQTARTNAASAARYAGQAANIKNTGASNSAPAPAQTADTAEAYATSAPSYGGTNFEAAPVAPPAPVYDEAWVTQNDGNFKAQEAALKAALDSYNSDLKAQRDRYDADYGNSLRKLGFTGDQAALNSAKWNQETNSWDTPTAVSWNQTDTNTASGRGFANLLNDFAARGMLQSSAFGQANNDFMRSLNDQLASTASARNNQFADWDRAATAKQVETDNARKAAIQEAITRLSSMVTGA